MKWEPADSRIINNRKDNIKKFTRGKVWFHFALDPSDIYIFFFLNINTCTKDVCVWEELWLKWNWA